MQRWRSAVRRCHRHAVRTDRGQRGQASRSRACSSPTPGRCRMSFGRWVENECVWLEQPRGPNRAGPAGRSSAARRAIRCCSWPSRSRFGRWRTIRGPPKWAEHPAILRTADVKPYFLRKVRILNGAHTALVAKVGLKRFETVREALDDDATRSWLERLLFEEIVPTLRGPGGWAGAVRPADDRAVPQPVPATPAGDDCGQPVPRSGRFGWCRRYREYQAEIRAGAAAVG